VALFYLHYLLFSEQKVKTALVNNSTNINKPNNHLLS